MSTDKMREIALSFPHRLDSMRGDVVTVETTHARLRAASFLDGREPFWTAQRVERWRSDAPTAPPVDRFVFHVGFCGSTLLARLLDVPGGPLVLREPQALTDMAAQRTAFAAERTIAPLSVMIDSTLSALGVANGERPTVVKPSNWVNSLVQDICAPARQVRAVFLTMAPRAFVRAVFRGGHDRIAFCTRLAAEMAAATPGGDAALQCAIDVDADPLNRSARIAALLHRMQEWHFAQAIAANGWTDDVRLDFDTWVADPAGALAAVRAILDLDQLPVGSQQIDDVMGRHSKQPGERFTPRARREDDDIVEFHHRARFDAAMNWLKTQRF